MRSFDRALSARYNQGHISDAEALRNADSANEQRKMKETGLDSRFSDSKPG